MVIFEYLYQLCQSDAILSDATNSKLKAKWNCNLSFNFFILLDSFKEIISYMTTISSLLKHCSTHSTVKQVESCIKRYDSRIHQHHKGVLWDVLTDIQRLRIENYNKHLGKNLKRLNNQKIQKLYHVLSLRNIVKIAFHMIWPIYHMGDIIWIIYRDEEFGFFQFFAFNGFYSLCNRQKRSILHVNHYLYSIWSLCTSNDN